MAITTRIVADNHPQMKYTDAEIKEMGRKICKRIVQLGLEGDAAEDFALDNLPHGATSKQNDIIMHMVDDL